ncbi:type II toxin-antitoxin system RelE/ParE family toxin [Massilia sp. W12]|uniref:type II toxin-antitoxin system RelE/ParE family toxin n=1 Tax=Massilia sp. W12 TaxID=3126507 RepID=UPI0030CEC540
MPRLIWSPAALQDMQRHYRFLANKDVAVAKRAIRALRAGVNILSHQPEMGRQIDNLPAEFRDWLIDFGASGYVVRYRGGPEIITLLRVRHQREAGF